MMFNQSLKGSYMFIPGIIALIMMLISAMMTSISITREKELGTMEVLLVTPLKPLQIILGKVTPYIGLAFINAVIIIVVGYFGFKSVGTRHFLGQYFNVGRFFRGVGQIFKGNLRGGLGMAFTGIIDIFVGMLELLSVFIRIMSFTFRLFGNMTAGEILLLMVMFLVAWVAAIPFYGLELLVGFVQALIFAGLTLVFLTVSATPHEAEAA